MSLTKIATKISLQAIGGVAIGMLVDSLFTSKVVDDSTFVTVGSELFAQLLADSVLTYQFFDFMTRKGYSSNSLDPTKSVVYLISLFSSQPNVRAKLVAFVDYMQKRFTNTPILLGQLPKPPMAPNLKQDAINGQVPQSYTQHYSTHISRRRQRRPFYR